MSLLEARQITGGELQGDNVTFSGVSTDSRSISAGELFVALTGENFNGHEFVSSAFEKGAAAALVSEKTDVPRPCLKVENTLTALQQLAASWRNRFELPVAGVTGSNGKTTVKELIGAILNEAYDQVLVTQGNLNNHIGVPLTLLRLNKKHQAAVIEMGMNHAGEISLLTQLARPSVALVNNAMLAHVEAFDSVAEVAKAKGEIFEGLDANGIAVLNADDENYSLWKDLIGRRDYIDFGLDSRAAISATVTHKPTGVKLDLKTPKGEFQAKLNLLGQHNARNALAAVATACALDIDLDKIKRGLESVYPYSGRLQPIKLNEDVLLLNDSYNANPDSIKAGIDVLMQLPGAKKILVAGDMGELGETAPQLHVLVGEYARDKGVDCFLSLGELMTNAAQAYGETGFNTNNLTELLDKLNTEIEGGTVVLVKGSRAMRMERVVEAVQEKYQRGQD